MKYKLSGYSPIGPISLLEDLADQDALGTYLLVLAHDVEAHTERYRQLIINMKQQSSVNDNVRPYVILDNSAVELDEPVPADLCFKLATIISANAWVLPDVLGERRSTVLAVYSQLDTIKEATIPFMRVPQGDTLEEVIKCIYEIDDMVKGLGTSVAHGELWAIPRWITNKFGSRKPIIQFLNGLKDSEKTQIGIHLLGMSRNFKDDIECTGLPNVIGIDSANPIVLGQKRIKLDTLNLDSDIHKDRGNLWKHEIADVASIHNCEYVRQAIKTVHFAYEESDV